MTKNLPNKQVLYNSAIKNNGTKQILDVEPTERFDYKGCIGMRRNVITEGLHPDFLSCDVIYCEPPFPAGIKVFDKRAKDTTNSYRDFIEAFKVAWEQIKVPKYGIFNKILAKHMPEPTSISRVKLNAHWENLFCYGPPVPTNISNYDACRFLGIAHHRIGDICCGYGMPVLQFKKMKPQNTFVASDYDPHCITVLRKLMDDENLSEG